MEPSDKAASEKRHNPGGNLGCNVGPLPRLVAGHAMSCLPRVLLNLRAAKEVVQRVRGADPAAKEGDEERVGMWIRKLQNIP
jgi:hypothetical protein